MKQNYKESKFLRNILFFLLSASIVCGVISGMYLLLGREEMGEYDDKKSDYFVTWDRTGKLFDGYIRLFEEYMQIGRLITEDGELDYDKVVLTSITGDEEYTIKELLKHNTSEGEAAERFRTFMEHYEENCEKGISYPWVSRYALVSGKRVFVDREEVFRFQSEELSLSDKRIENIRKYRKNMVLLTTEAGTFKEGLKSSFTIALGENGAVELPVNATSSYEEYIITHFPVYAESYFLEELLSSYEEGGQEKFLAAYQEIQKKSSISQEDFYQLLNETYQKVSAQVTEQNTPWKVHVVPRTMEEAKKYIVFLVETYQEMKYLFSHTNFVYGYENSGNILLTNHDDVWEKIRSYAGNPKELAKKEDQTGVMFAYYDSKSLDGSSNLLRESLSMTGNVMEKLKNIGSDFSTRSYQIAVGIDLDGVMHGDKEDVFFDVYRSSVKKITWSQKAKPVFLVSCIFVLLSFVLLTVINGCKEGELFIQDRFFLEFQLLLLLLFGSMIVWLFRLWDYETDIEFIYLYGCLMSLFICLICVLILSMIRRLKFHMAGKYSLCYLFVYEVIIKKMQPSVWLDGLKRRIDFLASSSRFLVKIVFLGGVILYTALCVYMIYSGNQGVLSFLMTGYGIIEGILLVCFILFLVFSWKKQSQEEYVERELLSGLEKIMDGDFSYQLPDDRKMSFRMRDMVASVNKLGSVLEEAVEESVKNERMKTELIANVSHDIKTPLTSVINYVDLMKSENIENEKVSDYIEILNRKSLRLKTLIEDLIEASKASTGVLELEIHTLNFSELILQTNGEFEDRFSEAHLELISELPEEPMLFEGDGRRVFRILENLYNNIVKYAMQETRVYASLERKGGWLEFSVKNVSEMKLNITPEELTERFVRGDRSRSTEGSGLGLSIAKNLTELMGGRFVIELDGDLFCARVSFEEKTYS